MSNEGPGHLSEAFNVVPAPAEITERIKQVLNPDFRGYEQLLKRMDMIVERGNAGFLARVASNEAVMENLKTNPWLLVDLGGHGANIFDDKNALDNLIFNSGLRATADSQSFEDKKRRLEVNPEKTKEESLAGVYWEELEPQIREAIIKLSSKGYPTFESGFRDKTKGSQYIGCWKGGTQIFRVPESLKEEIKKRYGIDILVDTSAADRDYLLLIPENPKLGLAEWKEVWDLVAEALPER